MTKKTIITVVLLVGTIGVLGLGWQLYDSQINREKNVCLADFGPLNTGPIAYKQVFPNLAPFDLPTVMLQAPGMDSHWFVAEQNGKVLSFENDDGVREKKMILDLTKEVIGSKYSWEAGLVGMAFHPDFPNNHYVFLYYTAPSESSTAGSKYVLSRFEFEKGHERILKNSEKILLSQDKRSDSYHSGSLMFGVDGYIYIGIGQDVRFDEYEGDFKDYPSQDTHHWAGSILRIDVDKGDPYAIPPDNPFAQGGGLPEVFAYGLRNPWGMTTDPETKIIYVADVGDVTQEEVNILLPGKNYGWPYVEGDEPCHNNCPDNYQAPFHAYHHNNTQAAVIGGMIYRGKAISEIYGNYLFADLIHGVIWGLEQNTDTTWQKTFSLEGLAIHAFTQDSQKNIYLLGRDGRIHQLVPAADGTNNFPKLLSETGCLQMDNPSVAVDGVIPYQIRAPLEEAGVQKERFLSLPDNKKIKIDDNGFWKVPSRTIFGQNFWRGERLIETRLLMHHKGGTWKGYSYEWNDEQTEATLLLSGKKKTIDGLEWTFPSRGECQTCHTRLSNYLLGLTHLQLNTMVEDKTSGKSVNQWEALKTLGVLDPKAPAPKAEQLPKFDDESYSLEERAKAYLHVNCAHCHQAGGIGKGDADYRYSLSFSEMHLCDQLASDTFGIEGARLLKPGSPEQSMISYRLRANNQYRMPPMRSTVDEFGANLIDNWIASIEQCP